MKKHLLPVLLIFCFAISVLADVTFYGDTTLYLSDGDIEVSFDDSGISMEYCEYDTSNNYILLENINLTTTTEDEVHIQVSELDSSGSGISVGDTVLRYNATVWGKYDTVDDSEDVVSASGDTGDVTDIANMYDENYNTYGYLLASGTDKTVSIYEYYNNVPTNVTNIVFYAKTKCIV